MGSKICFGVPDQVGKRAKIDYEYKVLAGREISEL